VERKGIPAVAIVTDRFEALARSVAGSLGRPFLQLAVIPHPLGGLSKEEVYGKAEGALEDVVRKAAH
jgi:hypothetical protein